MKSRNLTKCSPSIPRSVREIQASWSPEQRCRRAQEGARRREELFSVLGISRREPDVWAVGAAQLEDSQRVAG
jgi:hypothetical protein